MKSPPGKTQTPNFTQTWAKTQGNDFSSFSDSQKQKQKRHKTTPTTKALVVGATVEAVASIIVRLS